ncbi:hypothetical protein KFK09_003130 [Dendrobium nobile]|uniref:Uncharacterized protein n=1 Tax=Dendrobium nobile TaxID=94219 RepID=A0A8T3C995_DENNO|nr:hypothetical protein KFK09_003130 [Dendrobium nobile]
MEKKLTMEILDMQIPIGIYISVGTWEEKLFCADAECRLELNENALVLQVADGCQGWQRLVMAVMVVAVN